MVPLPEDGQRVRKARWGYPPALRGCTDGSPEGTRAAPINSHHDQAGPATGRRHRADSQRVGSGSAGRGSADFDAVDDDVAEVVVRGVVEGATTGDQPQFGIGYWAEHHGRGEVRLRVLTHPGDP